MVDWSKVGKRSRRKGQVFERKIASLLTKATGLTWRRTPASGGMEWKGDVICTDIGPHEQPFIIECKDRMVQFDREYINGYKTLCVWAEQNGNPAVTFVVFTTNNRLVLVYQPVGKAIHTLEYLLQYAEIALRQVKRRMAEDGKNKNNIIGRSVQDNVSGNRQQGAEVGKRISSAGRRLVR